MQSSMVLNNLELSVRLGCLPIEQMQDQTIGVDIKLQFSNAPRACQTDNLDDTICYDLLISKIKNELASRKFRLIEHLGHEIYQIVRKNASSDVFIGIRIKKKPLIINLKEGVTFHYGDKECMW